MKTIIHETCGEVSEGFVKDVTKLAHGMLAGEVRRLVSSGGSFYLQRCVGPVPRVLLAKEPMAMPGVPMVKERVKVLPGGQIVALKPEEWGPPMWKELHKFARVETTQEAREHFLASFTTRIPCGDCKNHWKGLLKTDPPDFSTAETFFRWSVQMHNAVNDRLKKPLVGLGDAKFLYPLT